MSPPSLPANYESVGRMCEPTPHFSTTIGSRRSSFRTFLRMALDATRRLLLFHPNLPLANVCQTER